MKKMTCKSRLFGGFAGVAAMLFAVSCAQGFDDNETWKSDVTGAQLESPALTEANFSTRVNADGSESVQVSWPVVKGAGGYECYAAIVDDPENPVELVNQTIDGTSFSFEKREDTKYEVRVRTLGNEKLNNTEAASATVVPFSTLVPAQKIPAGEDIVAFVQAHMLEQDKEQAFELEAGAAYEINAELDFGKHLVTFRGDKVNRPTVTFGYDGVIRTQAGLKVKFINFDCESMNSRGVIECSQNPDPSLDAANFPGYNKAAGKIFILHDPIVIQECNFRQIPRCLFFVGRCAWGIEDIRVSDCVVQLNNDGSTFGDAAVFCTCGESYSPSGSQSWSGAIRNITVKNSTLYNLKDNSKNRMIRFWNKDLSRHFDSKYGSATFENCTISKIMNGKEFANNTPNYAEYAINFNYNICYDCWRLQKFIQRNDLNVNPALNTIWGVKNPVDNTDKTRCATEEDPQFVGPIDQPWDLSKEDGGVNFKATGAISSTIGDPRWK